MQSKNQHYKKKALLGEGTFGKVYKCLNQKSGKNEAIKIIQNVSWITVQDFQKQAEAMKIAKSDNTVPLIDWFYEEDSEKFVFVMPYYKKGNLSKLMGEFWNKDDILCFLYQICQAFISIGNSCWHLDLKPDNIIIKNQGQYLVCDFGCAKLIGGDIECSRFLALSMGNGRKGIGTTLYAAPEIILDLQGGTYSDMWSLGIILYEILYKKHPLEREKAYSATIKEYTLGAFKINFPNIKGFQSIIEMCEEMLKPKKRLSWIDLKNRIYKSLKLPHNTPIVCSLQKFINYIHDISKIILGLIHYLNLNRQNLQTFEIEGTTQRFVVLCKAYMYLLFMKARQAIFEENSTGYVEFFIFPVTKRNIKPYEKQKMEQLVEKICAYTEQDYKTINDPSLTSMKMVFNEEIKTYYDRLVKKAQIQQSPTKKSHYWQKEGHFINPIYQWNKITQICQFILDTKQKMIGLNYGDKEKISSFAKKVVYN